jgi:hypothetical protein
LRRSNAEARADVVQGVAQIELELFVEDGHRRSERVATAHGCYLDRWLLHLPRWNLCACC